VLGSGEKGKRSKKNLKKDEGEGEPKTTREGRAKKKLYMRGPTTACPEKAPLFTGQQPCHKEKKKKKQKEKKKKRKKKTKKKKNMGKKRVLDIF